MDTPRVGDPFWDSHRKQANGYIKKIIKDDEDAEYPEILVYFYDGTHEWYDGDQIQDCYTLRYGVGGWEI